MYDLNLTGVSTKDLLLELKNRGAEITLVDFSEIRYEKDGEEELFDTNEGTIIYLDTKVKL